MRLKYRILSGLGIWFTGIYENGECVDWYMRQTIIRRTLNRIWDYLRIRGIGDNESGDLTVDINYL